MSLANAWVGSWHFQIKMRAPDRSKGQVSQHHLVRNWFQAQQQSLLQTRHSPADARSSKGKKATDQLDPLISWSECQEMSEVWNLYKQLRDFHWSVLFRGWLMTTRQKLVPLTCSWISVANDQMINMIHTHASTEQHAQKLSGHQLYHISYVWDDSLSTQNHVTWPAMHSHSLRMMARHYWGRSWWQ